MALAACGELVLAVPAGGVQSEGEELSTSEVDSDSGRTSFQLCRIDPTAVIIDLGWKLALRLRASLADPSTTKES